MNDLLTSRQVQEILKVDRITIYRMLNDGRFKGVKIGQQWRFHLSDVERMLGIVSTEEESAQVIGPTPSSHYCIPTIPVYLQKSVKSAQLSLTWKAIL